MAIKERGLGSSGMEVKDMVLANLGWIMHIWPFLKQIFLGNKRGEICWM